MNSKVLLFLVALATVVLFAEAGVRKWHELEGYTFELYVKEHNKRYASQEEFEMRKEIFARKLAEIREHNARPGVSWKKGVNHLTDRTEAEFRRLLGVKKSMLFSQPRNEMATFKAIDLASLPDFVDWREQGVVSPVKDQGMCGSCWTFGTAETVESHYAIATGLLPILSEQQILDCTANPNECGGTGGCAGGTTELAYLQIINQGGLASEWTYPYQSYFGKNFFPTCSFSNQTTPPVAKISSYVNLPSNEYAPVIEALATVGPLAISLDASAWSDYEEGVFTGCNNTNPDIDHAVQLVGYGVDPEYGPYWLVRNSWSPSWGEAGYIRLARSSTPPCGVDLNPADGTGCKGGPATLPTCGECAILFDANYPIIAN